MNQTLVVLFFFGITIVWFTLPFLPGFLELRRKTDIAPLRVVPEAEVDIRHFAHGFHDFIHKELQAPLDECRSTKQTQSGVLADGSGYFVVAGKAGLPLSEAERRDACTERLVLATGDLSLPPDSAYLGEIYVMGTLIGGERNIYRAVLAERDVHLKEESSCLRWLHSGGAIRTGEDCTFFGRVSADQLLQLAAKCRFERLNAPRIEFGVDAVFTAPPAKKELELTKIDPKDLPHVIEIKAGRCLVNGKLELPPRSLFEVDLVVKGQIKIGAESRLLRSLKCDKDVVIEDGVEIRGALVSGRGLRLGRNCEVHGPLLAERKLTIGEGCQIGSEERPTTISAEDAEIGSGAVAHGTVWAHRRGRVLPAAHEEGSEHG